MCLYSVHLYVISPFEQLGFAATARHVGERCEVIIDGIEESDEGTELIGHHSLEPGTTCGR